jgi:hypothetical protein
MTLESALEDTSYSLELERLKNKIGELYNKLLTQTFKSANPTATPEDIGQFLESNALEFKGEGFEDESSELERILEDFLKTDDIDEVSKKDYEEPEAPKGPKLKSSNDTSTLPKSMSPMDYKGGLFSHADKRSSTNTKALKTPTGSIKRTPDDKVKMDMKSMQDIWDAEREKLLTLVRKRNKEHNVRFW